MSGDLAEIEKRLWAAADDFRANSGLKPSEYAWPVLGMLFLRQAETRFNEVSQRLGGGKGRRGGLDSDDYKANGALYLPEEARFSHLLALPGAEDLGKAVNGAMAAIEKANTELEGALPRTYGQVPKATLQNLLKLLAPLDIAGDAFGKVYEYFMGAFAMATMQKGGEFYTPESIVRLIVEVIEPYHGRILDPACGSGGMFVHSAEFVRRHQRNPEAEISVFGTEKVRETLRMCRMNLAVHGLWGNVKESNTYYEDPHNAFGGFDFVMANPPFNVDGVDKARIAKDPRFPWGIPGPDNANYLWIQLFWSALNSNGRAGFVMANSAGDARGSEAEIRRKMIETGTVDVIVGVGPNFFYTVTLPCTLWFTGFDVPTCSTIYLDKPMRNHTLMQTIARANRTARGKTAGLIVDYVGVFGNLKRALEVYAAGGRDAPAIRDKGALVEDIQRRLRETKEWMAERGVSVDAIVAAEGLAKSDLIGGARAKLTLPDDVRMRFLRMSADLWGAFKAALPDPLVGALFPEIDAIRKVDTAIREHLPRPRIGDLAAEMEDLLDRSVVGVEITRPLPDPDSMDGLVNLGAIDFERLRALFAKGRGQSAVQLARNDAEKRAKDLAAQNPTRQSFLDRYQQLVADYNERRMTAEEIFAELMRLIDAMAEEDRRHARENLDEEELALFDVLTQPDPQLPDTKRDEVKDIARDLLAKLKSLFSGIDWQVNPTMRAKVRTTIKGALRKLPDEYDDNLWEAKVAATVDWVFRRYGGASSTPP